MNDKIKERWVARDGSIYTEKKYSFFSFAGIELNTAKSIAFNVGDDVAKHIVEKHNESLPPA